MEYSDSTAERPVEVYVKEENHENLFEEVREKPSFQSVKIENSDSSAERLVEIYVKEENHENLFEEDSKEVPFHSNGVSDYCCPTQQDPLLVNQKHEIKTEIKDYSEEDQLTPRRTTITFYTQCVTATSLHGDTRGRNSEDTALLPKMTSKDSRQNYKMVASVSDKKDKLLLDSLSSSSYQGTKGTNKKERDAATLGFNEQMYELKERFCFKNKLSDGFYEEMNESPLKERFCVEDNQSHDKFPVIPKIKLVPYSDIESDDNSMESQGFSHQSVADSNVKTSIDLERRWLDLFEKNSLEFIADKVSIGGESRPASDYSNSKNHPETSDSYSETNNFNSDSSDSVEVENFKVKVCKTSHSNGQRVYDKKDFCLYCDKAYSKLTEHLRCVHENEKEISLFLSKNKGSEERRLIMQTIRNKGNFLHNKKVLAKQQGEIVPCKRPSNDCDSKEFLPCEFCLGFYHIKYIARHCRSCPLRTELSNSRTNFVARSLTFYSTPSVISDQLKSILSNMKTDNISMVVRNDELILKYGEMLCQKYLHNKHLNNDVSQKMRELGRLVLVLKNESSITTNLTKALIPENFNLIVECIKKMTNLLNTGSAVKPTLALKLGYSIQKCITILKSEAIMKGDDNRRKKCDDFTALYDMMWSSLVVKRANEVMDRAKGNKPSMIPIARDVAKLSLFLRVNEKTMMKKFEENSASEDDFKFLTRLLLVHVISFNRKRVGEVERLEKSVYLQRIHDVPQGEIEESFSKFEKLLLNNLTLIHIRGKHRKKVPLLLTPKMVKYIDLILLKRSLFGVLKDNKYVFAKNNSDSYYRGSEALRDFSRRCGAEEPSRLTSTRLKEHIVTVSQILNLRDQDLELLARHLGHSINVHREFYRLPHNTLELAKLSKLLIHFERGVLKPDESLNGINLDLDDEEEEVDREDEVDEDEVVEETDNEDDRDGKQFQEKKKKEKSGISFSNVTEEKKYSEEQEGLTFVQMESEDNSEKVSNVSTNLKTTNSHRKEKIKRRLSWTKEESKIVSSFFERHILRDKIPSKSECDECIRKNPDLKRSWVCVKSKVHNIITTNKKKKNKYNNLHKVRIVKGITTIV